MADEGWESAPEKSSDEDWESATPEVKTEPKSTEDKTAETARKPTLWDYWTKPSSEMLKNPHTPDWLKNYYAAEQGLVTSIKEPGLSVAQFVPGKIGKKATKEAKTLEQEYQETAKQYPIAERLGYWGPTLAGPVSKGITKAASVIPAIPKVGGKTLQNLALQSGMQATLTPTDYEGDYEDFLSEKGSQVAEAAGLGAITGKGTQMLLNPKVGENLKYLKELGMKYFTPGQLTSELPFIGDMFRNVEQAATSMPLTGRAVAHGMQKSVEDFNRAVANKALSNIDETLPKGIKAGNEMMRYLSNKVESSYDKLENKIKFTNYVDPASKTSTMQRLNEVASNLHQDLTPEAQDIFNRTISNRFMKPLLDKYGMDGKAFRTSEKGLGKVANTLIKTGDPEKVDAGYAIRDFQEALRAELTMQNPDVGKQLRKAHEFFKDYLRLEKAASYRGAEEGVFSPSQLKSSAESLGTKKQAASGTSIMLPEAQAAMRVLGGKMPDSYTASRLMTAQGIGGLLGEGLAYLSGGVLPLAIAGSIYNQPVMGALTKIATERPDLMRKIEPGLSQATARASGTQTGK